MDDIISQGEGDRPPLSRRKRIAIVAALVAVAALVVAEHLPPGHRHDHAAGQRPLAGGPLPGDPLPGGIAGATVKPPAGIRVPRTGSRPVWFVPAKDKTEPIGGLPADKSGYSFTKLDS